MGSRLKEEEKNEKAIRNLLRKGANRRCINCNSLGPQYVCLNFWTFVCTQCSGIHREFTHRVKSVSMSKFTSQEVTGLENGGNERGREIHFKDWDPQRQPLPDSSNVDRVRDFIKMVYVDKRFSGERPLPRRGDREDNYDNRRPEPRPNYRADSRSPPYEDRYDDRALGARRSNFGQDERRYDDRGIRYDEKRSPGRFETDRNRYDRSYNDNRRYDDRFRYDNRDRHYEDRYNEGLDRRFEERFANERGSRDHGGSSPPPIRPVKEILGEDVPPLRVEDHGNHINGSRDLDKSNRSQDGRGQRFGSSSSFGSVDGSGPPVAPSIKRENSASLIDFMAEPEPPTVREQTDPFGLTATVQPSASNSSSTGWATFDMSSGTSGPAAPLAPGASTAPAQALSQVVTGGFDAFSNQTNGNAQWATQWPAMPTASVPPSVESTADDWTTSLVGPSASVASSQPWSSFPAAPATTHVATSHVQVTQEASNANNSAGPTSQALPGQKSLRPEIPEDLFSAPQPGLQMPGAPFGPPYAVVGGMGMQVGSYNRPPSVSRNPFDLPGDSSTSAAAGEFPNLGPLQAALPNLNMGSMPMPGSGLSGFGHQWNQTNTMVPPPVSYPPPAMSSASGYYTGQTLPNALPQAMQGPGASSMGMGMPGGFVTAPKQGMDSLFPLQSAPQFPSQSAFGAVTDFPSQGAATRIPLQNPVGPAGTDAFFTGRSGQRLTSYGSLGSLNSLPAGTDSLFPTQPLVQGGQRLVSQGSLGSLSSFSGPDSHFGPQPPSQFPTQSSLSSVGNPFG